MGWFSSNTESEKTNDGVSNQENHVETIVKNEVTINNDLFLLLLIIIAASTLINLFYNMYKSHIKTVKKNVRRENITASRIDL